MPCALPSRCPAANAPLFSGIPMTISLSSTAALNDVKIVVCESCIRLHSRRKHRLPVLCTTCTSCPLRRTPPTFKIVFAEDNRFSRIGTIRSPPSSHPCAIHPPRCDGAAFKNALQTRKPRHADGRKIFHDGNELVDRKPHGDEHAEKQLYIERDAIQWPAAQR